ncbi:MAG: hypothetical protein OHK0029_04240 [Armatimonadaceae bacterium]
MLIAAVVLIVMGGATLFLLGREDPRDPAFAKLAWGDRVEKQLDAFIDGVRPAWADRIEARLDAFLAQRGWK